MAALQWWQTGVIYQIYPRSFQDTNGDGIGDLPGITARLDYLAGLGVDAIWISPFYPSPMKDFGYDVADYTGVDPIFGTMQDFDTLLREAHARGLRVILDFVPNHSSDQHPWFLESRSLEDKREARLVSVARPAAGRRRLGARFGAAAEQLDVRTLAGPAWQWDEQDGGVLSAFIFEGAAGPELAQS